MDYIKITYLLYMILFKSKSLHIKKETLYKVSFQYQYFNQEYNIHLLLQNKQDPKL